MIRHLLVRPAIGTGLLLLIPLVMTLLDRHKADGEGWRWGIFDFVVMGGLLFCAGVAYEFVAAKLGRRMHKTGLALSILCVVFAIWAELAVGGISKLVAYLS
jgi:predicted membrane-bound spermidine synthase